MKARLCFPGHQQRYGSDYSNALSLTVAMASFRLFMTICKYCRVILTHMDIRNAYLHAEVDEEIYMQQPEGFIDKEHPMHICKLKKALYSMHQAGYNWHKLIDKVLCDIGMTQLEHDACVDLKFEEGNG